MIVEKREYSLVPSSLPAFMALYQNKGWPAQLAHLQRCMGYYSTEFGDVNGIVHLWAFDDCADRSKRRAALNADPAWRDFLVEVAPYLHSMQNSLLNPAPFASPNEVTVNT